MKILVDFGRGFDREELTDTGTHQID